MRAISMTWLKLWPGDYHVDTSDTTPGSTWSQNVTDRVNKWGGLFEHLDAATADVKGLNYDRIAERNQLIRQGIDAVSSVVPYDALPVARLLSHWLHRHLMARRIRSLMSFFRRTLNLRSSMMLSIVITQRMSRSQIPLLKLMLRGINGRILKISRSKNLFRSS